MTNSNDPTLLLRRFGPVLCRIAGALFILSGLVALAIGTVVAFGKSVSGLILFVLFGSGVFDVLIGVALIRYLPVFIASRLEKQIQK